MRKNTIIILFLTVCILFCACSSSPADKAAKTDAQESSERVSFASEAATAEATQNDTDVFSASETAAEEAAQTDSGSADDSSSEEDAVYSRFEESKKLALEALGSALEAARSSVYVYRDFGDTENHFTQKAKMSGTDGSLVMDMDEDWRNDPHSAPSCIRCQQITAGNDWGGWLFLNGVLNEGETVPRLNDGSAEGQGMDLTGAESLTFWARGENGGETVEFFTCGFGYDGESNLRTVEYPDSATKHSLGWVTLEKEWKEYVIDLSGTDLSSIACGFGYVLSGRNGEGDNVFYLDDVRFVGDFSKRDAHIMLRSYDTDDIYIKNAAFSYDNALAAMAFISEGRESEAAQLLDSFVYAAEHDRYQPGRVRNAYAAGDITAFPGWNDAARLPGWYDAESGEWYEDRYQVGCNVGNTSYVALALLRYDAVYGNESYLNTAKTLMDWVINNCSDQNPGFTGGYDGWPEGGGNNTYPFTYKSIEHNIDAYAAFSRLYEITGEERYADAASSALSLILSMWDEAGQVFFTGTLDDGVTPSTGNIVLDAQVWACMALGDVFAPYEASLLTVADMKTDEGGYPFCASNENGGWWAEGTAYTALMYRLRGDDDSAIAAFEALCSMQLESGFFPAASVNDLSTGFELFDGSPWEYGTSPHIAPTAWYVMALNSFNPYVFPND